MNFRKADILGIEVASLTMQEAVTAAEKFMDGKVPRLIATANAEMIMRTTHDDELKNILNTADLVVPDGAGTVWASNYLGVEMPERVAGFDLVQNLFANAPAKKRRIFFFGSAPGVAEKAKAKAEKDFPGIQIVGVRDGYFKPEEWQDSPRELLPPADYGRIDERMQKAMQILHREFRRPLRAREISREKCYRYGRLCQF